MRRFLFGKKFGCWLVSAALFLLSGCGSLTKFRTLGSDAVDRQSGYTSVVMWKLRIIDRTGLSKGSAPEFQIAVGGDHVRPRQGRWTEGEGAAYYECLYVTEAKNHDFNLWKISIYFKSRGSLDIFPKITWRVTPDSLLYIGAFDVEILELVRGKKG